MNLQSTIFNNIFKKKKVECYHDKYDIKKKKQKEYNITEKQTASKFIKTNNKNNQQPFFL